MATTLGPAGRSLDPLLPHRDADRARARPRRSDAVGTLLRHAARGCRLLRLAVDTFRSTALGGSLGDRLRRFLGLARASNTTRDLIQIRCDRGAEIARQLGFPDDTADAIRSLDEHWNGRGYPGGFAGDAIPRPYRQGMSRAEALAIINRDRATRLCSVAIEALEAHSLAVEDPPTEL